MISELLREYQSLLGALLAVIITLITTAIIRSTGRIYLVVKRCWVSPLKLEKGSEFKVDSLKEAGLGGIDIDIDIFNNSEIPKNLRNIQIEFKIKIGNKSVCFKGESKHFASVNSLHIPPKNFASKELSIRIEIEKFKLINEHGSKVYFKAFKSKRRKIRRKIGEIKKGLIFELY